MSNSYDVSGQALGGSSRGRSIAVVIGAAVLSIGASSILLSLDGPPVSAASKAAQTAAQPQPEPVRVAGTIGQTAKLDPVTVPPAAPAAAEPPRPVAALATTTNGSAIAAPEPERVSGVGSEAVPLPSVVPLPRPAPRVKIAAVVDGNEALAPVSNAPPQDGAKDARGTREKSHRRRPRNPFQVIGTLFKGWRR